MNRRTSTLSVAVATLVCGCTGAPFLHESQGVGSRTLEPWGADPESSSRLYARDGSPVPDHGGGAVTTTDGASRDLGDDDGSRPYLLALYQSAVDQKEKLELEVAAMQRELDEAGQERTELRAEKQALELRIQSLEEEAAARDRENLELAARLTTAQIRRLEAEKLVLETTLEWSRFQSERTRTDGDEPTDVPAAEDEH